jgi:hypothetical protein
MIKRDITPLRLTLVLPVFLIYVTIVGVGMFYHELWLDESQHFLIGRDSDSLSGLYWNMRYDGHPRLWNFMLFFVTHFISSSYIGMQVLHWLIVAGAAWLFLRYAPFTLPVKMLILSGYYFLFEYSVLSRNYAPGILLLFGVCVLLREPRKYLLWIGVLLFLMCNMHLFFAFAATGVFFYLAMEYRKEWLNVRFLLFTILFVVGFVCVAIQTRTPPEDSFHHAYPREWLSGKNLSFAAFGIIRGWLPLPQAGELMSGHFWNTYWINDRHINGIVCFFLFVFFLVFPGMLLRRNRKAMVFYFVSLFWLFAFFVVTQQSANRYFGMVFIYFLAALWMSGGLPELSGGTPGLSGGLRVCLYGILFVQTGLGVIALQQDISRPFSSSKDAVDFLKANGLDRKTIILDGYNGAPMISAYLGRKLYCATSRSEASYVVWKTSYWPRPRPGIAQEIAGSAYLQSLDDYILVSTLKLDTGMIEAGGKRFRVTSLASFTNSILRENFFIYQSELVSHE